MMLLTDGGTAILGLRRLTATAKLTSPATLADILAGIAPETPVSSMSAIL